MAYYLGTDHKGLPIQPFLGAVLIRDTAVLFLIALVLHDICSRSAGFRSRHGDIVG
jgi:hypothetical protein